jgi:hypothetical protein
MELDKEKPCTGSIRGINLAVVRPTTVQLTSLLFTFLGVGWD